MLHILNGDSSTNTLRESSVAGEYVAWREALVEGPAPGGLDTAAWLEARANHLAEAYDADVEGCTKQLEVLEQGLSRYREHDEVVLWFEHDLFCQVHLIYLLNWFATRELGQTRLSLICISDFRGMKRLTGLGPLNPQQMASLFDTRQEVSDEQKQIAAQAWSAYTSPDPTKIDELLSGDTSALPFLKSRLRLHLARFPSTRNGLGRVENIALREIAEGRERFIELFPAVGEAEPGYGMGDSQIWLCLKRLARAREPLLAVSQGVDLDELDHDVIRRAAFKLTGAGESVLGAQRDFIEINGGIDQWLGGVHLCEGSPMWRWDEDAKRIRHHGHISINQG
jgi:hypothetical protein